MIVQMAHALLKVLTLNEGIHCEIPSFFFSILLPIMYSRHLFIKTNQSCNLQCKYCYEKEKNNSSFNEDWAFLKIIKILKQNTISGTKIKLIGGEPFLVYEKIRKFCERIWELQLTEKIHFQITTNGTLVHGEIQEWLRLHQSEVDCKLSLDGNRFSQEINRPNSFDKIDIRFFSETWEKCVVNMVVTPETLPYFAENVIFLHENGFGNIVPLFAVFTDWTNNSMMEQYYEQLMILVKYYIAHPEVHRCLTLNHRLDRILSKCDCILCDIGKKIIYDLNSERYYPCHLFFPSVCGNNHPKNMDSIDFSVRSNFEYKPCSDCVFINICHTCYAANYIERGDLGKRDMSICAYRKIDFFATAQLEYHRIVNSKEVTSADYLIMKAISEMQPEFEQLEKQYAK